MNHRRPAGEDLYRRFVQGAGRARPDAHRSAERDQAARTMSIRPARSKPATRSVRISVEGGVTQADDIRELRLRAGDQVTAPRRHRHRDGRSRRPLSAQDPLQRPGQRARSASSWPRASRSPMSARRSRRPTRASKRRCPIGVRVDQIANQPEVVTERSANS